MLLIGASGRARHGKTIFCEAIVDHVAYINKLYDFKDVTTAKIYDIGSMIRLVAIEDGRLPADLKRENMTREHLQILIDIGKEKRTIAENYWVDRLLAQVLLEKPDVALCPNLRLPMEAQAFRNAGGYVVRCQRLNKDGSIFISEDRPANDITETALQFWPADFYLTTIDGDTELMGRLAVTIYDYLKDAHHA